MIYAEYDVIGYLDKPLLRDPRAIIVYASYTPPPIYILINEKGKRIVAFNKPCSIYFHIGLLSNRT